MYRPILKVQTRTKILNEPGNTFESNFILRRIMFLPSPKLPKSSGKSRPNKETPATLRTSMMMIRSKAILVISGIDWKIVCTTTDKPAKELTLDAGKMNKIKIIHEFC